MPKIKVTSTSSVQKKKGTPEDKPQTFQQNKNNKQISEQQSRRVTSSDRYDKQYRSRGGQEEESKTMIMAPKDHETQSSTSQRQQGGRTFKADKSRKQQAGSKSPGNDSSINQTGLKHPNDKIDRRFRPSDKALSQIRKFSKVKDLMFQRAPFQRFVRDVTSHFVSPNTENYRWTPQALEIIQAISEDYLINLFEDAYACTLHGNRVTLMQKDLRLARRIRGILDPGNGPI